ncbi:arylesterase [Aestuariivita boseongensis]|uniref:arylesterase n=1 Tax=Aestuariivita boseongensis TaxID=1470562 RepID=UPI00068044C5|nr:arylesterase [Aestuariivita boseongensis]
MRKAWILIVFLMSAMAARAETVTIAALGDSLTQGYGLVEEDGFVPQLQRWLAGQGADVRLINAGVSGDTTAGGAARVAWTLTPDVDAMIVALGGNDLLRGIDPVVSRANIEAILREAQARDVDVLLVGMEAPGNYGADFKAQFDAIYPDLSATYDTLYLESFFAGFGEAAEDPARLRDVMQGDGIHPNAKGVAQIVEGIGPKVLDLIARAGAG